MRYSPTPPGALADLPRFVFNELQRIAGVLVAPSAERVTLEILHSEPRNVSDGTLVYADGADWDPGGGAGVYARVGGSWSKL